MLELVKTSMRLTTDVYNDELLFLIESAMEDLGIAGVIVADDLESLDAITKKAIITYCKMNFGLPEDYDKLKESYDEQKAQLASATGHTYWREF